MKNMLKSFAIAVMLVLVVVSCKKKNEEPDITSLPYAKETVDQGKTNLESTGQQVVAELSSLADVNGVPTAKSMTYFIDKAEPFAISSQSATAFAAVEIAGEYGTSKDVKGIVSFLSTNVQSEKDSTFQEIFTQRKGIYTWNNSLKKWSKTLSADKIELVFPSDSTKPTVNDAKFDLTYTSKQGTSTAISSNGELPLSLNAVLYLSTDKVLEYSFTAQYDNDGIPTNVSTFLALYPFKFEVTATNNSSSASLRYLLTDNTKTIFDLYAGVNGDMGKNNIDTSSNPQDIVTNANAYFQVFNIKLAGRMDVKGLSEKMNEIDNNFTAADSVQSKARAAAMNQYMALVLIYADTQQKIAQAEFYSAKQVKNYYSFTYTSYSEEMRFIFTDSTKGDLKTYLGNGFKDVVTDFNTLLVKLNTKYNLGAKPVTYDGK